MKGMGMEGGRGGCRLRGLRGRVEGMWEGMKEGDRDGRVSRGASGRRWVEWLTKDCAG